MTLAQMLQKLLDNIADEDYRRSVLTLIISPESKSTIELYIAAKQIIEIEDFILPESFY